MPRSFHCGDISAMWEFRFQTSHHNLPRVIYDHRKIQDLWRSSSPISSSSSVSYELNQARSFRDLLCFVLYRFNTMCINVKKTDINLIEKSDSNKLKKTPNPANHAKTLKASIHIKKGCSLMAAASEIILRWCQLPLPYWQQWQVLCCLGPEVKILATFSRLSRIDCR